MKAYHKPYKLAKLVTMIPKQSYSFDGIFVETLYLFVLICFVQKNLASPTVSYCRHDQRDALLELKHEFPVNESYSTSYIMSSWNNMSNCCYWEGVGCDAKSGKVIELFLDNVIIDNTLKPNSSLFRLQYLQHLRFSFCNLNGEIPFSIGNLSHLTHLVLSSNELVGQVPTSIRNLTQLTVLILSGNKLSGKLPASIFNLTKLTALVLDNNYLESGLSTDMSRVQNLEHIFAYGNSFSGLIPKSICELLNLVTLDLGNNNFNGPIPKSISQLTKLSYLYLYKNKMEGKVPGCLWKLVVLNLSYSSFSSFGRSSELVGRAQMRMLRLDSNIFRESFPHWICKFTSIGLIDLSNNSFSGSIPQCLSNTINVLHIFTLQNNNFTGIIPDVFVNATNLNTLDVSHNQLKGKLPASLINCKSLKLLNVGNNNLLDKFPSWLGYLQALNILIVRSNQFYGPLYHRHISIVFLNLKVIDVSHNDLSGTFPSFYFSKWQGMTTSNTEYEHTFMDNLTDYTDFYLNSMELVHKGVDTQFEEIRKDYIAIDFAENKFYGNVPQSIGLLKGLLHLNFSNNAFSNDIPKSLANLTNLETLDLSQNQMIGQIPRDLGILYCLSTMNFSHNNFEGPIPRSTQFESQNCTSFMGNPKLYGLEEICGKTYAIDRPHESDAFSEPEEQLISWIGAAIAYGPGVFCGLVIGHIFVSHKYEWLMENFHSIRQKVVIRESH